MTSSRAMEIINVTLTSSYANVTSQTPTDAPDFTTPRTAHFLAIGIIIPLGLFFNTLSFVVFAASPSLRMSTTGHYLLSLAIADSAFLVGEFFRWLNTPNMHHLGVYVYFLDTNDFMCRSVYMLRYVSKLASAWLTVAITIERYITVAFPLKVTRISTQKIAKLTIAGIYLFSFVMGMFPLWTVAVLPYNAHPGTACLLSNGKLYNVFNWISLRVGSLLLPGLLIILFSCLICVELKRAQTVRLRKLSLSRGNSYAVGVRPRVNGLERQLTVMLLAVAFSFILFRLPYTITFYLNHYKKSFFPEIDKWGRHKLYVTLKVTDIFVSLNYASNFFLYCWCGSTFRKQLRSLFIKSHVTRRRSSNLTSSSLLASSRSGSLRNNFQIEMSKATKEILENVCERKIRS